MKKLIAFCVVLVFATSLRADVVWKWHDESTISPNYSVGTGDSASLMIVDFQNDDYYSFEYKYDASAAPTSWNMIQAVGIVSGQANPDNKLEYTFTDYGATGIFINSFSYDGNSETAGSESPWPGWVFYLSDNDTNDFSDTSPVGIADRNLSNGSWDGWSWHANGWGTGNPPVPEPATMGLLALGGLVLLKRRKEELGK